MKTTGLWRRRQHDGQIQYLHRLEDVTELGHPRMPATCPTCGTSLPAEMAVCAACQVTAVTKSPAEQRRIPLQEVIVGQVGYASEAFLYGWFNRRRFEDQGTLVVYDDDFAFSGQRGDVYFPESSGFELIGPVLPRSNLLGYALGVVLVIVMVGLGVLKSFTLDDPLLYVLLGVCGLLALGGAPLVWIKVRYRAEDGRVRNAYLAASGLFGGTRRIFRRLCELMTDDE